MFLLVHGGTVWAKSPFFFQSLKKIFELRKYHRNVEPQLLLEVKRH